MIPMEHLEAELMLAVDLAKRQSETIDRLNVQLGRVIGLCEAAQERERQLMAMLDSVNQDAQGIRQGTATTQDGP